MNILFPPRFKWIGLALFLPSAIIGVLTMYFEFEISWLELGTMEGFLTSDREPINWTNELAFAGILMGLAMLSFSRMKMEDEWIQKLRLEAFILAFQISLGLLFITNFIVFSFDFFQVLVYHALTPLVLFNLIFWIRYSSFNKDLDEA